MTSLEKLLVEGAKQLAAVGIESPRLEAEVLLRHVLGLDRARLYANLDQSPSSETKAAFFGLIERRQRREPLAYITGKREFFGREFLVDARVLIPRPETELLVETVLDWLRTHDRARPRIVDVGTGSGAIAITLAKEWPTARVYAVDLSPDALEVAMVNACRHGVHDRVEFLCGSLLEPLTGTFDVIAANLPYIAESEIADLQPEVRDWEPRRALVSPEAGIQLIRELVEEAPPKLSSQGLIALEIGLGQADIVRAIAERTFPAARIGIQRDLAGIERIVTIDLATPD